MPYNRDLSSLLKAIKKASRSPADGIERERQKGHPDTGTGAPPAPPGGSSEESPAG
jgi:hypothetical protein